MRRSAALLMRAPLTLKKTFVSRLAPQAGHITRCTSQRLMADPHIPSNVTSLLSPYAHRGMTAPVAQPHHTAIEERRELFLLRAPPATLPPPRERLLDN